MDGAPTEYGQFSPLIAAMLRPEFYAVPSSGVELRQTHISFVFLTGPHVYKVKKAVKFPFLDYSTLELRRHYCEEEVRLNRRLAPNTYLGIVAICRSKATFLLRERFSSEDRIVEYAVKMRRLPEACMLASLLQQQAAKPEHVIAIAERLAGFHHKASTEKASKFGSLQAVTANTRANFRETRRFIDRTITARSFAAIQSFSEAFLQENAALLTLRVGEGRVREGHGDLRAEHICLGDNGNPIEIFDCIEFDEGLRYGDVASEVAFLSMDLDFLDASDLAGLFERSYATATGDGALHQLLPFYKCYRAYVRGKVQSLKSEEPEISKVEKRIATLQALRYFCLATRYSSTPPRSMLLMVCGQIGTGKSTVAGLLNALTGFPIFASDRTRKRLAGLSPTAHSEQAYQSGIYSKKSTRLTYHALLKAAEEKLTTGQGAIIDATFADPLWRSRFLTLGQRSNVPVLFIECRSSEATIKERLLERAHNSHEVSEATWDIYQQMRDHFAPFVNVPANCHLSLDTERELMAGLETLQQKVGV